MSAKQFFSRFDSATFPSCFPFAIKIILCVSRFLFLSRSLCVCVYSTNSSTTNILGCIQ